MVVFFFAFLFWKFPLLNVLNSLSKSYFFQLMFKQVKFDGRVRDDATDKLHTFHYNIERDFRLSVNCPAQVIDGIPCSSGFGLKSTTYIVRFQKLCRFFREKSHVFNNYEACFKNWPISKIGLFQKLAYFKIRLFQK